MPYFNAQSTPKPKQTVWGKAGSLFGKALDVISTPLYATVGTVRGLAKGDFDVVKNSVKGIKEKQEWTGVARDLGLKGVPAAVAGLIGNIVLDPINLVGAGMAKGVLRSIASPDDVLRLSDKGMKVAKGVQKEMLTANAAAPLTREALQESVFATMKAKAASNPNLIARAGLTFKPTGTSLLPASLITRPAKAIVNTAKKVPYLGDAVNFTEDALKAGKQLVSTKVTNPIINRLNEWYLNQKAGSATIAAEKIHNKLVKMLKGSKEKNDLVRNILEDTRGIYWTDNGQLLSQKVLKELNLAGQVDGDDLAKAFDFMKKKVSVTSTLPKQNLMSVWDFEQNPVTTEFKKIIDQSSDYTYRQAEALFDNIDPKQFQALSPEKMAFINTKLSSYEKAIRSGEFSLDMLYDTKDMMKQMRTGEIARLHKEMEDLAIASYKEYRDLIKAGKAADPQQVWNVASALAKENVVYNTIPDTAKQVIRDPQVVETVTYIKNELKQMLADELKAGINMGETAGYLPHIKDMSNKNTKYILQRLAKEPGFAKSRALVGSIDEINEKYGGIFIDDVAKLIAARKYKSLKAQSQVGYLREILERTGKYLPDTPGKDYVAPEGYSIFTLRPEESFILNQPNSALDEALSGFDETTIDATKIADQTDDMASRAARASKYDDVMDIKERDIQTLHSPKQVAERVTTDGGLGIKADSQEDMMAQLKAMLEDNAKTGSMAKAAPVVEPFNDRRVILGTDGELKDHARSLVGKSDEPDILRQAAEIKKRLEKIDAPGTWRDPVTTGIKIDTSNAKRLTQVVEPVREKIRNQIINAIRDKKDFVMGDDGVKYYFHTTLHPEAIVTAGMKRGGLSYMPYVAQEYGNYLTVFKESDLPKSLQGLKEGDLYMLELERKQLKNISFKPQAVFNLEEIGYDSKNLAIESVGASIDEMAGPPPWADLTEQEINILNQAEAITAETGSMSKAINPTNFPDLPSTKGERISMGDARALGMQASTLPARTGKAMNFLVPTEASVILNKYKTEAAKSTLFGDLLTEYYDPLLNFWKGWAMGATPATMMRNMVGNVWNNYLAGTKGRHYLQAKDMLDHIDDVQYLAGKTFKTAYGDLSGAKLMEDFTQGGILGKGFFSSETKLGTDLIGQVDKMKVSALRRIGDPKYNPISTWIFENQNYVENMGYLAHYIGKIEEGFTPFDAIMSVKKHLFDYSDLTQFEQSVMKRIMPFYTFTRKNLPLQLENIINQPAKYSLIAKLKWMQNEIDPQTDSRFSYLPEWLSDDFSFKTPWKDADGSYLYMNFTDWLPSAQINMLDNPIKNIGVQMASPLIKAPVEFGLNYNSFYGEPISKFSGQKERLLGMTMDKKMSYILKQIRILSEMDKLIAYKSPNNDRPWEQRLARYVSGLRLDKYNPKKSRYAETVKGKKTEANAIKRDIYLANSSGDKEMKKYLQELLNDLR